MGQEPPKVKRILELNPSHPLVTGAARPRSRSGKAEKDLAELLYGMALLAEGGDLAEPAAFVTTLAARLQKAL